MVVVLLSVLLLVLPSSWVQVATAFVLPAFTAVRHGPGTPSWSQLAMSLPTPLDTATSGVVSLARFNRGVVVQDGLYSPEEVSLQLLELYDVENNRDCRRVRELLTELDLSVGCVIPSAPNSRVFVDPNYKYALPSDAILPRLVLRKGSSEGGGGGGEDQMLEGADAIVEYLETTFGIRSTAATTDAAEVEEEEEEEEESPTKEEDEEESPTKEEDEAVATEPSETSDGGLDVNDVLETALNAVKFLGSYVAAVGRVGRGSQVSTAAVVTDSSDASSSASARAPPRPALPLILYSYEGNQFCRLVREVLLELDLPYQLRSVGKGSPRREELAGITPDGSTQCPYLMDPNTSTALAESADIVRYLYETYASWTPPSEVLQFLSPLTQLLSPLYKLTAPLQAGSNREDEQDYQEELAAAVAQLQEEIASEPIVIYTYDWSPFCTEAVALLDSLKVPYRQVSLGKEWIPGLLQDPLKRVALGELTGQTSLPHVFVASQSLGGLFSGSPGLLPALEQGLFYPLLEKAKALAGPTTASQVVEEQQEEDEEEEEEEPPLLMA